MILRFRDFATSSFVAFNATFESTKLLLSLLYMHIILASSTPDDPFKATGIFPSSTAITTNTAPVPRRRRRRSLQRARQQKRLPKRLLRKRYPPLRSQRPQRNPRRKRPAIRKLKTGQRLQKIIRRRTDELYKHKRIRQEIFGS